MSATTAELRQAIEERIRHLADSLERVRTGEWAVDCEEDYEHQGRWIAEKRSELADLHDQWCALRSAAQDREH